MEQHPPPPPPLPGLGEKNGERESKTARKVTQNPRYFFPPKPNGNACYAGYNFPILDLGGSGRGGGGGWGIGGVYVYHLFCSRL